VPALLATSAGPCTNAVAAISMSASLISRPARAKKATVAVGHTVPTIAYHRLTRSSTYTDLGAGHFDERDCDGVRRRLVGRLEKLGYKVITEPTAA
jgi:hypothetical protein